MSEYVPESKPASVPESAEDPWRLAFIEFKTRDEKMVKDYQEEIDTLLVFVRGPHRLSIFRLISLSSQAGLFSAVLTAFVVESYQSLQEDYTQTSVDLLRHISHQLANSSFPAAPNSSQFQAQLADVHVNGLWFVSLLLSLAVALFGIFLKQWMRTYIRWTDATPDRRAVALRQIRYRSLVTWRLAAILTLLPTLLQLSVILFLSGLLVFLWHLNRTVADAMLVLSSIVFFVIAIVTVLPTISRLCPFRSPVSEILAINSWFVVDFAEYSSIFVATFIQSGRLFSPRSWHWVAFAEEWQVLVRSKAVFAKSWLQADDGAIFRYNRTKDHVSIYVRAMVHLCRTTSAKPLLSAAITAILKEDFSDIRSSSFIDGVWWPLANRICQISKSERYYLWARSGPSRSFSHTFIAFQRFSTFTQGRWLTFLLHSKTRTFMGESDSNWAIESYLLCCIACKDSATYCQRMLALMEVLEARFWKLEDHRLYRVACWLIQSQVSQAQAVVWDSKSGSSTFPEMTAT
jgi:hypothetical protein